MHRIYEIQTDNLGLWNNLLNFWIETDLKTQQGSLEARIHSLKMSQATFLSEKNTVVTIFKLKLTLLNLKVFFYSR